VSRSSSQSLLSGGSGTNTGVGEEHLKELDRDLAFGSCGCLLSKGSHLRLTGLPLLSALGLMETPFLGRMEPYLLIKTTVSAPVRTSIPA
jgi:hypothetical protein